ALWSSGIKQIDNLEMMYLQMAAKTSKIIEKERPDKIHLLNFESIPFASIYYKLRYKLPCFATVNGPIFSCFIQTGIDYKGETCVDCRLGKRARCSTHKWGLKGVLFYMYSLYYMAMLRLSYRFIDKFFIVSEAMRPVLTSMGVDEKKIVKIYNPIELAKGNAVRKNTMLYVGRLSPEKGVDTLIEALAKLPKHKLIIVGEKKGEYLKLSALAKKLGIEKHVTFTGYVDNKDLSRYYEMADVAVLPGRYYEPLSRFLIEATSYGLPLVARDIGGNSEILNEGKNGLFFTDDLPSTITQVYSNWETYSKNSKKIAVKFDIKTVGAQLMKEYGVI
ncbi:MAG: glycosyltransferase family 4 protein, partial [Nanoarchaeota archaeon]|nr:glycosyltransferase family 4 protein [Nanoarchaeota archaeon]